MNKNRGTGYVCSNNANKPKFFRQYGPVVASVLISIFTLDRASAKDPKLEPRAAEFTRHTLNALHENTADSTAAGALDSGAFTIELVKSLEGPATAVSPEKLVLKLSDLIAKAEKTKDGLVVVEMYPNENENNANNDNELIA